MACLTFCARELNALDATEGQPIESLAFNVSDCLELRGCSGWDAFPGCLLEGVGELNQSRLAAGAAREAHAKRCRRGVETVWKRWTRRVWHQPKGYQDRRIAWPCR